MTEEELGKKYSYVMPDLLVNYDAVWNNQVDPTNEQQVFIRAEMLKDGKWFLTQKTALEVAYQKQLVEARKHDQETLNLQERIKALEAENQELRLKGNVVPGAPDKGEEKLFELMDRLRAEWAAERANG